MGHAGGTSKTHGPTHDHPQDITPAFVPGHNTVGHQEGHGAAVINHDPIRHRVLGPLAVGLPEDALEAIHERHKQIGAIIVVGVL